MAKIQCRLRMRGKGANCTNEVQKPFISSMFIQNRIYSVLLEK